MRLVLRRALKIGPENLDTMDMRLVLRWALKITTQPPFYGIEDELFFTHKIGLFYDFTCLSNQQQILLVTSSSTNISARLCLYQIKFY
jgi:hypothetical protein